MCVNAHVAKVTYVSLCTKNKNNSITCKFAFILNVFPLCFTRCKIKLVRKTQIHVVQSVMQDCQYVLSPLLPVPVSPRPKNNLQ